MVESCCCGWCSDHQYHIAVIAIAPDRDVLFLHFAYSCSPKTAQTHHCSVAVPAQHPCSAAHPLFRRHETPTCAKRGCSRRTWRVSPRVRDGGGGSLVDNLNHRRGQSSRPSRSSRVRCGEWACWRGFVEEVPRFAGFSSPGGLTTDPPALRSKKPCDVRDRQRGQQTHRTTPARLLKKVTGRRSTCGYAMRQPNGAARVCPQDRIGRVNAKTDVLKPPGICFGPASRVSRRSAADGVWW